MPLYEYRCKECLHEFESFASKPMSADEDCDCKCPKCSGDSVRKGISVTSEPVFKGKGFYATDYKNKKNLNSE